MIEDIGTVKALRRDARSAKLDVASKKIAPGVALGDSVAVNGVCLTVVRFDHNEFTLDAMPETMMRTNLGLLKPGSRVNLERALRQGDRLGGHIVSGHVDGTGSIRAKRDDANATWVYIRTQPQLLSQMVQKGSIAIDGVSLTLVDVDDKEFSVCIIPHTGAETTLLSKKAGETVNLECDIIAKYVNAAVNGAEADSAAAVSAGSIDMEFLRKNGFA